MSLTFLYGSTLWIVTSVASAQLAFPGALEQGAAISSKLAATPAHAVASSARDCPYCFGGDCIMCGQNAFRMDWDGRGSHGGLMFDEPCYMSPNEPAEVAASTAPRATEPDDLPAMAETLAANGSDAQDDARGGILSALSSAVEHTPGAGLVRQSLSSGAMEASRALALARQWLASRPPVATAPPPPSTPAAVTRTEASEKLRQWFGSGETSDLAAADDANETHPHPAVTSNVAAEAESVVSPEPVAEIDSLVPAEVFSVEAAANDDGEKTFVDWEAEVARAYLAKLHDECGEIEAEDFADPRHDVVTPTIRTAAFALENLGRAAIQLSGRLRSIADTTAVR